MTKAVTKKTIYIAYTGGTIGMQPTTQGFNPFPGFLAKQMAELPAINHEKMPNYVLNEYSPLIDSANATPQDWVNIAKDILENYSQYDGFVILHGTDTMAYTASALSFLLPNLDKPVIITGSQIPIGQIRNDAACNIIDALLIANHHPIPEVCLYFNNYLLRGNRSQKTYADRLNAFRSPNFPPLAEIGIEIKIREHLILPPSTPEIQLPAWQDAKIAAFRLFPGFSMTILEHVLAQDINGIILESYGTGNAPNQNLSFLKALQQANNRGVVIVNCTQCLQGAVKMQNYSTGHALLDAGVISGHDMTPEAALTKLSWLFSCHQDITLIKNKMTENLRGELTAEKAI
ncbi:L-asparaginase 1 [Piscirickettsia salmonis]|uniref:asparaginase n=1 Tax=Piscirickettsia salmonis TaxID=1238 RepID=UPI0012B6B45A|nr:asparaginase [Piscirickettsia salmonis]QGP49383.1 L-asparaginase 1 [Piscirickettsia salmonis]